MGRVIPLYELWAEKDRRDFVADYEGCDVRFSTYKLQDATGTVMQQFRSGYTVCSRPGDLDSRVYEVRARDILSMELI